MRRSADEEEEKSISAKHSAFKMRRRRNQNLQQLCYIANDVARDAHTLEAELVAKHCEAYSHPVLRIRACRQALAKADGLTSQGVAVSRQRLPVLLVCSLAFPSRPA